MIRGVFFNALRAKAWLPLISETLPQIGASAIQVFGGAGFTWEYDVQLFYKRLLTMQMTWGGSEAWLEELATLVIDREAPPITAEA